MPSSLAELIAGLKSLTTLRLSIHSHLPRALSEQLKQCTQLKHLYLSPVPERTYSFRDVDSDELKEDPTFSLAQHMPFLDTLSADLQNGGRELVNRGLPNLREFRLFCTFPHIVEARWWTVPTVHFFPPKGYFRDPSWFVKKIETATRPDAGFAIGHLIIQVQTVSPKKSNDPNEYYYEQVIPEMLELLQRVSTLKRLDFADFVWLDDWSKSGICLPTVKVLKLFDGKYGRSKPITLKALLSFTALFPSLTNLRVARCNLLSKAAEDAIFAAAKHPLRSSLPTVAALLASEMPLRAVLDRLRRTSVIDFRYRSVHDSKVELRFSRKRSGNGIEFEAEWWWL